MKKLLLAGGMIAAVFACSQDDKDAAEGAVIFKKSCVLCHGADGKLGLNGAKDLTASLLTLEERMNLIRKGKNTMTPFEGILSPEQIEAVARYTLTMKK